MVRVQIWQHNGIEHKLKRVRWKGRSGDCRDTVLTRSLNLPMHSTKDIRRDDSVETVEGGDAEGEMSDGSKVQTLA